MMACLKAEINSYPTRLFAFKFLHSGLIFFHNFAFFSECCPFYANDGLFES